MEMNYVQVPALVFIYKNDRAHFSMYIDASCVHVTLAGDAVESGEERGAVPGRTVSQRGALVTSMVGKQDRIVHKSDRGKIATAQRRWMAKEEKSQPLNDAGWQKRKKTFWTAAEADPRTVLSCHAVVTAQ